MTIISVNVHRQLGNGRRKQKVRLYAKMSQLGVILRFDFPEKKKNERPKAAGKSRPLRTTDGKF